MYVLLNWLVIPCTGQACVRGDANVIRMHLHVVSVRPVHSKPGLVRVPEVRHFTTSIFAVLLSVVVARTTTKVHMSERERDSNGVIVRGIDST